MNNAGAVTLAVVLQDLNDLTTLEKQSGGSDAQIAMVAGTIAALGVAAIFGRRVIRHWWHRKRSRRMRRRRHSRRDAERLGQTSNSGVTRGVDGPGSIAANQQATDDELRT
jgi:hypothetical protein